MTRPTTRVSLTVKDLLTLDLALRGYLEGLPLEDRDDTHHHMAALALRLRKARHSLQRRADLDARLSEWGRSDR